MADKVAAHTVYTEDRLGDDRPAEQGPEVKRRRP